MRAPAPVAFASPCPGKAYHGPPHGRRGVFLCAGAIGTAWCPFGIFRPFSFWRENADAFLRPVRVPALGWPWLVSFHRPLGLT